MPLLLLWAFVASSRVNFTLLYCTVLCCTMLAVLYLSTAHVDMWCVPLYMAGLSKQYN
jgi:hypothetical protein